MKMGVQFGKDLIEAWLLIVSSYNFQVPEFIICDVTHRIIVHYILCS